MDRQQVLEEIDRIVAAERIPLNRYQAYADLVIREKAEAFDEGANAFAWAVANGDSPAHYVLENNPYRALGEVH